MTAISFLRLLRLLPVSLPGKARLARVLVDSLAPYGEAELDVRGLRLSVPSLREPIASNLLVNGVYEPLLCKSLARVLKPDGIFFDVGANVGFFSLLAAHRIVPAGRVVAFEASPRIFAFLEKNAKLQPRPGLQVIHAAVTERTGDEISFFDAPSIKFGMGSLANRFGSEAVAVKSISLDDAAEKLGLAHVNAIKVDVEGYELGVLRGARRLLTTEPTPVVFFEFNDWAEANPLSAPGDAQRFLQELGYITVPMEAWSRGERRQQPVQVSGGAEFVAFRPSAAG